MSDSRKTTGFLTSVSTTVKIANSANQSPFRNCTVVMDDQEFQAIIWEKSYQNGVTIGDEYTCELKPGLDKDGNSRYFITVLNGTNALVPTTEHFAHLFADITV
jgi:hypothetical protein